MPSIVNQNRNNGATSTTQNTLTLTSTREQIVRYFRIEKSVSFIVRDNILG